MKRAKASCRASSASSAQAQLRLAIASSRWPLGGVDLRRESLGRCPVGTGRGRYGGGDPRPPSVAELTEAAMRWLGDPGTRAAGPGREEPSVRRGLAGIAAGAIIRGLGSSATRPRQQCTSLFARVVQDAHLWHAERAMDRPCTPGLTQPRTNAKWQSLPPCEASSGTVQSTRWRCGAPLRAGGGSTRPARPLLARPLSETVGLFNRSTSRSARAPSLPDPRTPLVLAQPPRCRPCRHRLRLPRPDVGVSPTAAHSTRSASTSPSAPRRAAGSASGWSFAARPQRHLPDALFEIDGERHAIEAELSRKRTAKSARSSPN